MAQIEVVREEETGSGWRFGIQVLDDAGTLRRHEVRLSWADYNLWSTAGADEPARLAAAAVHFLLSRLPPDRIRPSFDASLARRLFPDADEEIPGFIH